MYQNFPLCTFFLACAPNWKSYGHTGFCYQHFPTLLPWNEARLFCQSAAPLGKEGELASIQDNFTNTFLTTITTKYVWIGGHQEEESGGWQWSDASRWRFSNWGPGKPNNDPNQNHVAFNFGTPGTWNNVNFQSEKSFICQYKGKSFLTKQHLLSSKSFFCTHPIHPPHIYHIVFQQEQLHQPPLLHQSNVSSFNSPYIIHHHWSRPASRVISRHI